MKKLFVEGFGFGRLAESFRRKPTLIEMEQVGPFSQVDCSGLNEEQTRMLLEGRVQAMKGDYGTTPGGIIAAMRRAKEICAERNVEKVDLLIIHDVVASLLLSSGMEIDLTKPETVNKAWLVVLS